ncbi:MAG TPA: aldose 1-epimerase family protein [Flavipsychrobacter sp.]|nr:aldose 1-epimerase family protein [Flavipsychrobacter sp.]
MVTLNNGILKIKISHLGAELQSIYNQEAKVEYLWNADPAHWAKHSPVLFPIVGQLRDNSYQYKGKNYSSLRHGFARDMEFTIEHADDNSAIFLLSGNEDTLSAYPFIFRFRVHYTLNGNRLSVTYEVNNDGNDTMYFSVGGHPAFAIPFAPHTQYTDYYLEFEKNETASRWPLQNGLILPEPEPLLNNEKIINLKHDLFYKDALVFKHLSSSFIALKGRGTSHSVTMFFGEFPFFGVWAAPDAPFVCLEPWHGLADSVYHNRDITTKEGINILAAAEKWKATWSIDCQ